jgi:hypothetical protein
MTEATIHCPASPEAEMFRLSTAHWHSCCIYAAARLGIPDLLARGPQSADAIARATDCDTAAVYRLMRALASIHIFSENEKNEFEMTPLADTLTSSSPNSMQAWVLTMLGERFIPWGQLLFSVKTGQPSFKQVYDMPVWQYYNTHQQQGENYARAMEDHTRPVIRNVVTAYDFSRFSLIADIGGGNGALLFSILAGTDQSRGILFDQPAVAAIARDRLEQSPVKTRCAITAGNFFELIPEGADCYIMKNIIHDWNDDNAILILKVCVKAMKTGSKLLLLEAVIPEGNEAHPGKFMDINMLVIQGGRERTEKEFKQLAITAGLEYMQTIHTGSPECSIIEMIRTA